jgi:hypothetical protein
LTGLGTWLVIALVLLVALPGRPPEHATLHYSLTFSGTSAKGTIAGTWGGTAVVGAYSDGLWGIAAGGTLVVGGTYHCNAGCTFNGTVTYLGVSTAVSLVAKTLGDVERTETVSGDLSINLPHY